MATWLARVHFPDCQVRYARYSTVVEEVYDELFGHCRAKNETDALGDLCHRGEVSGEPAPVDRGKPLSEPGNIVPVRIEVEPDGMTWPALYCPRQKRIVGPHSKFFADTLQQNFNLVVRSNQLHLVHAWAVTPPAGKGRRRGGEKSNRRDLTLCAEPAVGEVIAFLRTYYPGKPDHVSQPRRAISTANGAMGAFAGAVCCTSRR